MDLVKFRKRDPEVMEKVYLSYKKKLYAFLLIKTNNDKDLAEELFSETIYSMMKYSHQLGEINKVLPWLLQIANRKLIDYIRKKEREKLFVSGENKNPVNRLDEDIIEALQKKQKILLIHLALDNMKTHYQTILELKYLEEKSIKEIGSILRKTEKSVESLLFRARKSLKKEIRKSMKEFF